MRKIILRLIAFLSLALLVGGLVFIYSEFYQPQQSTENIALKNENIDSKQPISKVDADTDEKESSSVDTSDESINDTTDDKSIDVEEPEQTSENEATEEDQETQETDKKEKNEKNEEFEKVVESDESNENNNKSIVESSDKIDNELRNYNQDRINTYEDYLPIIPIDEINDDLIGSVVKIVGVPSVREEYKNGYLTLLENNNSSVRVYHEGTKDYLQEYAEAVGILSKDSSGYLITSEYLEYVEQAYKTDYEEAFYLDVEGVKGEIVKKEVSPEGHINLILHDQNRKEFEVNIPNLYNPIPNHYSINQSIIIQGDELKRDDDKIDITSLSSIHTPLEEENTKVHRFGAADIIKDNWGKYGVINVMVKDLNVYSDNTVYLLLENNGQTFHGTLLSEDDQIVWSETNGITKTMEERIMKLENAMTNNQEINLFGLINFYNDSEEFIIVDAYHN